MRKRKHYIIDKKFQLKTTISIIGITSLIVAIIIGSISINIANNNKKLENIILIQNNVVEALITFAQINQDRTQKIAIKNIAKDHYNNIETIKNIINLNITFVMLIIIFAILQCIILFFIMIRKTHKISGPAYVLSGYIKEILKGNYPEPRSLREGDELREIHALFVNMIEYLKEKEIRLKSK